MDPAQESLIRALQASFNILFVLMIVLLVLYAFSGVFRVEAGQQGLVARLGALRTGPGEDGGNVFGPGWYFALPDPFDKKETVPEQVQTLTVTTFLFDHPEAATSKNLGEIAALKTELNPGVDGALYTGDKNLSHGRWEVQYRIKIAGEDAENGATAFMTNIGKEGFEALLQRLTETAVVREVAGRTVEEVTRNAIDEVRKGVQRRLQASLDRFDTGVQVVQVVAYTIEPGAVRDAFSDVTRAENEKLTLETKAKEKRTEILNRAAGAQSAAILDEIRAYGNAQAEDADEAVLAERLGAIDAALVAAKSGQVAVRLGEARAEANAINERLKAEYEEFTKRLEERAARPRIALLGLWTAMREEILGSRENEIFYVPHSDEIEILVNRDPVRQMELDEERRLKQQAEQRMGAGR